MICHVCGAPIFGNDVVVFSGLDGDLLALRAVAHIACRAVARTVIQGPVSERWGGPDEYQLTNGRWAPRAVIYTRTPYDISERRLDDPDGRTFVLRAAARAISSAMAAKWLRDND